MKSLNELNSNHIKTCPCFFCNKNCKLTVAGIQPGSTLHIYEDHDDKINSYYMGRAGFNSISTNVPIGSNITVKMRKPGLLQFKQHLEVHDDTSMSMINIEDNHFNAGQLASATFNRHKKTIAVNDVKIIDLYHTLMFFSASNIDLPMLGNISVGINLGTKSKPSYILTIADGFHIKSDKISGGTLIQ